MRGFEARTGKLFSYVDLEARVPEEHPLRVIRGLVDEVLAGMSSEFEAMYASTGRPSIPPERLLRALLLQAFYSIRSERQLMEQLNFNFLFRWFVGLGLDDPVWDASRFSHNRERFLATEIVHRLLAGIAMHRRVRRLPGRDHFSVDGTQIQAWASVKSFRPRGEGEAGGDGGGSGAETKGEGATAEAESGAAETDGGATGRNRERDFHGERWSNETHASTTDGDARLYRKGKESRLCYLSHAMMVETEPCVQWARVSPSSQERPGGGRAGQPGAARPPRTRGRRARAMRSAWGRASGSRRSSAGPNRAPARPERCSAASSGST